MSSQHVSTSADGNQVTGARLAAAMLVQRLTSEGLIGMRAAAKVYGEAHDGRPPHASTPTRHAHHGVRLADGRVLKLEIVRVAGRIMTSRAAVLRFFAAQNEPLDPPLCVANGPPGPPRPRAPKPSAASAELDRLFGTPRDTETA